MMKSASRSRDWTDVESVIETIYDGIIQNTTLREAKEAWSAEVDSWFLMDSIVPVLVIALSYLAFVLVIGPRFMKDKNPYDLRQFIVTYNGALVIFSVWWLYRTTVDGLFGEWMSSACQPMLTDPSFVKKFDTMAWYYLMSKYVELLDTVFFILRRKQNQVTFLHVYHHTNMAISTWGFVKYVRGSQSIVIGALNTFVHVIMYTYYLLAACGPKFQKYLWWKKYITTLQIVQFFFVQSYLIALVCLGCDVHSIYTIYAFANTTTFLILFANFYRKAYSRKRLKLE